MSELPVIRRRDVIGGAVAIAVVGWPVSAVAAGETYGLIGRIKAKPGQRDALAAALAGGSDSMPGCLAYVVAEDLADGDSLLVTEIWENRAAHAASLTLPAVRDAIAKGRPLIAGFDTIAETRPISGVPGAAK